MTGTSSSPERCSGRLVLALGGNAITRQGGDQSVAEDYATVDAISDGRVELVAGRGILAGTYAQFGQDLEDSREIFREKLELLIRLWSEEQVGFRGKHRPPLGSVTVHPRPVQRPHPPLWIGGGSSNGSVDLAARLGVGLMLPSVIAPPAVFAITGVM